MPKFFVGIPTLEPFLDNVEYKASVCTKRRIDNHAKKLGKDWDVGQRKRYQQEDGDMWDNRYFRDIACNKKKKAFLEETEEMIEEVDAPIEEEVEIEEDTQDIFLPIHLPSCTTIDEGITFTID